MYKKLVDYKNANGGSIEMREVPEEERGGPAARELEKLRSWCNGQAQRQRRWSQGLDADNLTADQIEKLAEVGFRLAPSYDEMFGKLAAHKAETGALEVKEDEDEELFEWTKQQKNMLVRHFRGKPVALSDDRIQNLKSLGFEERRKRKHPPVVVDAGSARLSEEKKWDSMMEDLLKYKEDHGHFSFTHYRERMTPRERKVMHWVSDQRREYRNLQRGEGSSLTARRLQRLAAAGLDLAPRTEPTSWEQHIQKLREFVSEHGHCKPTRTHPLGDFVKNQRQYYRLREEGKPTPLTDERVNDLVEIGFVFQAAKRPNVTVTVRKSWEERFQELLAFKEEHGHTLVPQISGGTLGKWVQTQRKEYKFMKAGKKTTMTAERALRLTEAGFHWDASSRFKGTIRGSMSPCIEEVEWSEDTQSVQRTPVIRDTY